MNRSLLIASAVLPLALASVVVVAKVSANDSRRLAAISSTSEPAPLSWRGNWDAEAKYRAGDVVVVDGATYVAATDAPGTGPQADQCEGECPWALMGSAGAPGPSGPPGPPGPPGSAGKPGTLEPRALQLPLQPLSRLGVLSAEGHWALLYDHPGIGRLEAACALVAGPNVNEGLDSAQNPRVVWRYTNTTSEARGMFAAKRYDSFVASPTTAFTRAVQPSQTLGSLPDEWFVDRLVIFPLHGGASAAAPFADVFLGGSVLYDGASPQGQPLRGGQPTSCAVRALAVSG